MRIKLQPCRRVRGGVLSVRTKDMDKPYTIFRNGGSTCHNSLDTNGVAYLHHPSCDTFLQTVINLFCFLNFRDSSLALSR